MKARASLIKCLAVCLLTFSSFSTIASEQNLPEQFNLIKQSVLETVAQSQKVGAATTYHLLIDNLAAFRALSARVQQAHHMDEVIEELASELDAIADNFEAAARLRVDYSENTHDSRELMAKRHRETEAAIKADLGEICRLAVAPDDNFYHQHRKSRLCTFRAAEKRTGLP